jgi:hypothetical protein
MTDRGHSLAGKGLRTFLVSPLMWIEEDFKIENFFTVAGFVRGEMEMRIIVAPDGEKTRRQLMDALIKRGDTVFQFADDVSMINFAARIMWPGNPIAEEWLEQMRGLGTTTARTATTTATMH